MDYADARVFVTGADGFIGSHRAEALARRGAQVTGLALDNAFDGQGGLDNVAPEVRPRLDLVRGDGRDAAFVGRLVPGWRAQTRLREELEQTIAWWRERLSAGRVRVQMDYTT